MEQDTPLAQRLITKLKDKACDNENVDGNNLINVWGETDLATKQD